MPVLTAALICVGALCILDLVLTLGVVKRLREHTEMLSTVEAAPGRKASIGVGEEVGDFTAATVDGEPLAREDLGDGTLVAFFSPTCQPCKEKLPKFIEFASSLPGGRDRVLAAVIGRTEEAATLNAALSPVARVVNEEYDGPLSSAFQATAYPTVLMTGKDDTGRLVVTSDQVALNPRTLAA
ncbi:hypothetical protein KBZ21_15485 [Streptomyces sp. A73]|nr:hypothetical protein [Streptomyces sp. A73]